MKDLEIIDRAISLLKEVRKHQTTVDKLSEKAFNMHHTTHSERQINKANVDLNWACMNLDKAKTDFARHISGSFLDVSIEVKEYNPSGFHNYIH